MPRWLRQQRAGGNDARRSQQRRLRALDAFLTAYEAEHGEITASEMAAARGAVSTAKRPHAEGDR